MSSTTVVKSGVRPLRVALIGNPNTGKSTLFNALAGMRVRTGNYPGVTVEKKTGRAVWGDTEIQLIDLPGTYSLSPRSPDEMVTVNVLTGCDLTGTGLHEPPDVVICICNAGALERNLYLVTQVQEIGIPTVVCLNMWDTTSRSGVEIDLQALSRELGLPVVATAALRRTGFDELRRAVLQQAADHLENSAGQEAVDDSSSVPVTAASSNETESVPSASSSILPAPVLKEVHQLAEWLHAAGCPPEKRTQFLVCRSLLDPGGSVEKMLAAETSADYLSQLTSARDRLAKQSLFIPAVEATLRYQRIGQIIERVSRTVTVNRRSLTDRLDAVLTHRVFGFAICLIVMLMIFSTIYWFTEPLSGAVEGSMVWLSDLVTAAMSPGPFRSLMVDGVIAGVGSVLVFLPQIALLFLFIALLEDCGYMARAAFMMDRLMALVGLSGRSFLPLMSSYACAVPGIMATRVIESRRDRFVTILIAPLMSCSARLPVYMLMIGMFVPDQWYLWNLLSLRAVVLLAISMLGLIVAVPVAWILRSTFFRGEASTFLLELPEYRLPTVTIVLQRVRESCRAFVQQAGTLIFATAVIVWAAGSFPGSHAERYALMTQIEQLEAATDGTDTAPQIAQLTVQLNAENAKLLENSMLGRFGHLIEPAVKPLGWDWRLGVGVVASFPAREVIIATLGTIFSLGSDVEDDEGSVTLREALLSASWPDGKRLFNLPVALSVMVFFALCAQCVSTLVVIRRETNSWRWPIFSFTYMTILAWLGAFLVYQIGIRIG